MLNPPFVADFPQRIFVGPRDDQLRSGLEPGLHMLSVEITATRRRFAVDLDLDRTEKMLAHLQRPEHLATQRDDRGRALEYAGPIVGNRIVGETGGEPIPISIVEGGRITDQDFVDSIPIQKVL